MAVWSGWDSLLDTQGAELTSHGRSTPQGSCTVKMPANRCASRGSSVCIHPRLLARLLKIMCMWSVDLWRRRWWCGGRRGGRRGRRRKKEEAGLDMADGMKYWVQGVRTTLNDVLSGSLGMVASCEGSPRKVERKDKRRGEHFE